MIDLLGVSKEASYALQAFLGRGNLGYTQTKAPVDKNHFTAGNNFVSNYKVHRIGDVSIQFHHVARAEFKDFSEWHLAAAKSECGLKFNIQKQLDPAAKLCRWESVVPVFRS